MKSWLSMEWFLIELWWSNNNILFSAYNNWLVSCFVMLGNNERGGWPLWETKAMKIIITIISILFALNIIMIVPTNMSWQSLDSCGYRGYSLSLHNHVIIQFSHERLITRWTLTQSQTCHQTQLTLWCSALTKIQTKFPSQCWESPQDLKATWKVLESSRITQLLLQVC